MFISFYYNLYSDTTSIQAVPASRHLIPDDVYSRNEQQFDFGGTPTYHQNIVRLANYYRHNLFFLSPSL
jgi:hypothetical protein